MSLTLTNIPAIMRSQGWANGAKLMDTWFSRPAAIAPAYGPPETTTIRMDSWVLTYPRARQVYDKIITEHIWDNAASQKEITAMLRRRGFLVPACSIFTFRPGGVELQDPDYINYRVVDQSATQALDDLAAALANFVFRLVVAGTVVEKKGIYEITIAEVGIYVRDSYDFNGSQHLGYWDDSDNSVSSWNALSGTAVGNSDFSDWRAKNGKGGDFRVYSDIKKYKLPVPFTFIAK